ncbi:hypothetical protein M0805_001811, partial [Coniferiporia weirii]
MSDSPAAPITEGKVDFRVGDETFQTYYKVIGDLSAAAGSGHPLVTLHGGPGSTHDYLLSLTDLVTRGSVPAVIFYDQLGSGRSTHLPSSLKPPEFWTPQLFMDELANLLRALHLGAGPGERAYDLLGHSWGGMLGSQFASSAPEGLRRLVLSDSPASMPLWEVVAADLVRGMPADVQATLKKHEDAGTTDSKEYEDAMNVFYAKHLCRVQPMPEDVAKSFVAMAEDSTVYHTMNGPSEFHITGSLKEWTIIPELHRISVPTLILNGRYDEAQDACVEPFFWRIPRAKWYTFPESSHMP